MNLWPEPRYPQVKEHKEKRKSPIILAGSCFAEPSLMEQQAKFLKNQGITYMRGGVYRAGTYPPKDAFGLQKEALAEMFKQATDNNLGIILEVLDIRLVDYLSKFASALQVGARHMQDYALLRELRSFPGHVALKRGAGQTLDELLGAAEYLMGGNCKPILIERGGATYLNHVRWDLSISLIAAAKTITELPVIVDASHGTGRRDLVEPMTLAGIAAGADGWLVETHPEPDKSLSDAAQAVDYWKFALINGKAKALHKMLHKGIMS